MMESMQIDKRFITGLFEGLALRYKLQPILLTCKRYPISSPKNAATRSSLLMTRSLSFQSPDMTLLIPTRAIIAECTRDAPFWPHLNRSKGSSSRQQRNICRDVFQGSSITSCCRVVPPKSRMLVFLDHQGFQKDAIR